MIMTEKYETCPKCKKQAVHLAMGYVSEFLGDQDDAEGEESVCADETPPGGETPEVSLFAHICFECGHMVDVGIEHPRDKAINTSTELDPIYEKFQIQFEYKAGFSGHQWYACPFCNVYEDAKQNHDDDCIVRLVEERTNTKCVRTIGRETEWRKVE